MFDAHVAAYYLHVVSTDFPLLDFEGATVTLNDGDFIAIIETPNGGLMAIDENGEYVYSNYAPPLKPQPFEEFQGDLICPTCGHGEVHPLTGKALIRKHKFTDRNKSYSQCLVCAGMYTPTLKHTPKRYDEDGGWFTTDTGNLNTPKNSVATELPKRITNPDGIVRVPARIINNVPEAELRAYGWPKGTEKLEVLVSFRWRTMGYYKGAAGYKRVLEDTDRKLVANGYTAGKFVLVFPDDNKKERK